MQPPIEKPTQERGEWLPDLPSVSLILPFNPKMTSKSDIGAVINRAVQKITAELNGRYSGIMVEIVLEKLQAVLSGLNYSTHKCSLAIYISPVFEKVLYLDMPVKERITVDSHFEIRDIVNSKAKTGGALLLAMTPNENRVYVAKGDSFSCIMCNSAVPGECDRVSAIDHSLSILLPAYGMPLFVAGPDSQCLQFRNHSRYSSEVIQYLPGVEAQDASALQHALYPLIENREALERREISKYLAEAEQHHKLTTGIERIADGHCCNPGSLLLVEKGYVSVTGRGGKPQANVSSSHFSCIKDEVDDLIERALLNGGDVAFVEAGQLPGNAHIALIQQLH